MKIKSQKKYDNNQYYIERNLQIKKGSIYTVQTSIIVQHIQPQYVGFIDSKTSDNMTKNIEVKQQFVTHDQIGKHLKVSIENRSNQDVQLNPFHNLFQLKCLRTGQILFESTSVIDLNVVNGHLRMQLNSDLEISKFQKILINVSDDQINFYNSYFQPPVDQHIAVTFDKDIKKIILTNLKSQSLVLKKGSYLGKIVVIQQHHIQ